MQQKTMMIAAIAVVAIVIIAGAAVLIVKNTTTIIKKTAALTLEKLYCKYAVMPTMTINWILVIYLLFRMSKTAKNP